MHRAFRPSGEPFSSGYRRGSGTPSTISFLPSGLRIRTLGSGTEPGVGACFWAKETGATLPVWHIVLMTSAWHGRRIGCASRAWSTAQRRRSGLRSFPRQCPSMPASPGSTPKPDASVSRSPAPVPSAVAPDPPSTRRTPCANGNRSTRRSQLPCRPAVTSSRLQHPLQPVAADSRSAPPYASSLVPSPSGRGGVLGEGFGDGSVVHVSTVLALCRWRRGLSHEFLILPLNILHRRRSCRIAQLCCCLAVFVHLLQKLAIGRVSVCRRRRSEFGYEALIESFLLFPKLQVSVVDFRKRLPALLLLSFFLLPLLRYLKFFLPRGNS
jgi:hypothetical protein